MSNEEAIPLTRIKLAAMPLYMYERVVLRKEGVLYLGNVVSHLDLEDWVAMNGYLLGNEPSHRFAKAGEVTELKPHNPRNLSSDNRFKTVMGMTAVRVPSTPPPSSKRTETIMGIPLPAVSNIPMVTPTPIKIIK